MTTEANKKEPDILPAALRAQAEPFLRALFGEYYAHGHTGLIEVRIISTESVQCQFFNSIDAVLDALPALQAANEAGRDIYVGVNPRTCERGREEDVQHVVTSHTDVDVKNGSRPDPADLAQRGGIAPSMIIGSGHGLHGYWLLREPLDVSTPNTRAQMRGINAALAARLGADHCHDLSRVLRLPGFTNWKEPSYPKAVELLSCDAERRYSLEDFAFLHPIPLPVNTAPAVEIGNELPQLSARVHKLVETDTQVTLRWHGDPLGLNDRSRSGLDLSLASLLIHRDCDDMETATALRQAPYNAQRQRYLTAEYLARTIAKARADSAAVAAPSTNISPPAQESISPISLAEGKRRIARWLAFAPGEDQLIDVALAAKLANDCDGDPVFLVVVGPSSGAKTEILRGFKGISGTILLGSLTARTFASGLDPKKASLLPQLNDIHTLVIKDLGTILEMSPNEKGDLLQQLRDIFDGYLRRDWGSGKGHLEWTGRLGLLAGATPAIEKELAALSALGERFLFFRVSIQDRGAQARRALEMAGQEGAMRADIHQAIAAVLAGVRVDSVNTITVPSESMQAIELAACVATQARTPVQRDRYDKTLLYQPALEGPARMAKQLKKMAQALAMLYGQSSVTTDSLKVVTRIAVQSVPSNRARVISLLAIEESWITTKRLGELLAIPTSTTSRIAEDLAVLGIVERRAKGEEAQSQFEVRLTPDFAASWHSVSSYVHPPESADDVSPFVEHAPQNQGGVPKSVEEHVDA